MGAETELTSSSDMDTSASDNEKQEPSPQHQIVQPAKEDALPATPATPSSAAPGPPPNGGLQAWLQVLGGFCLFFNTW